MRERFDRFRSVVRVLRALFGDEARHEPGVTLDAPPFRLDGATMEPGPLRPGGPPIWLGGQGPRGLRIAARYADGWNFASNLDGSPGGFIARRDVLLQACEAIGRDSAELTLSAQIVIPGDVAGRRAALARAEGFIRAGAGEILLTTPARGGRRRDTATRHRGRRASPRRIRLTPDEHVKTAELLAAYLETALRWDGLLDSNAKAANRAFDEYHRLYTLLRGTAEGRQGITELMAHSNVGVRLLAATDSLFWSPEEAVSALESIEAGPGLHAVSAKYTLRSFRAGTLNLDW